MIPTTPDPTPEPAACSLVDQALAEARYAHLGRACAAWERAVRNGPGDVGALLALNEAYERTLAPFLAVCPFTEACRAQALAEFAGNPLVEIFARPACRETDPARALRCAEMQGLTEVQS